MNAAISLAYGLGDLFVKPIPIWGQVWILLLPLCLGVAIVYKAIRVREMRQLPKAAIGVFFWILLGMIGAAAALLLIVWLAGR
ncbi:MAG: hypothetical protein IT448_03400 [Phycisphaerales bacterium]|nr:hypothetical protein [Phycisphaerales bacterium]